MTTEQTPPQISDEAKQIEQAILLNQFRSDITPGAMVQAALDKAKLDGIKEFCARVEKRIDNDPLPASRRISYKWIVERYSKTKKEYGI